MKRLSASMKRWIRSQYWNLISMPVWGILKQRYESVVKRKQSYEVDANVYNSLFLSPPPSLEVFADSRVWDSAVKRLPEGYSIPDRASLNVLLPMTGEYYGSLFSNTLPMRGIFVDGSVWERIKAALPEGYVIPDAASVQTMKPMIAEHYNHLFSSKISARGIIVDSKVWKPIAAHVPEGYCLPDFATVDVLNKHKKEVRI